MTELKSIKLRLARTPDAGYCDGDPHRVFTIVAPLYEDGRIDVESWRAMRRQFMIVRFSPDAN